jgi:hypothetical protein
MFNTIIHLFKSTCEYEQRSLLDFYTKILKEYDSNVVSDVNMVPFPMSLLIVGI